MDSNNMIRATPNEPSVDMECGEMPQASNSQDRIVKKQLAECDFDAMRNILESAGLRKNQCVFLHKNFIAPVHSNGYY